MRLHHKQVAKSTVAAKQGSDEAKARFTDQVGVTTANVVINLSEQMTSEGGEEIRRKLTALLVSVLPDWHLGNTTSDTGEEKTNEERITVPDSAPGDADGGIRTGAGG